MADKIAVLIPCYNESKSVGKVVQDMKAALPEATIYVYDNNSTDKTVEKAKEAGAIVILDDNFKSIVSGIKEGRGTYSNIRKVSYLLLSCGLAEVLFFLLSVILSKSQVSNSSQDEMGS